MKKKLKKILIGLAILIAIIAIVGYFMLKPAEVKVLVFSKTAAYRHASIEAGVKTIKALGIEHGFTVVATEDAQFFTEENLKDFMAVVFLNTTGDVLDPVQQSQMERFIQAGGGFVGVHAATDTEYGWPWYGKLVGAYFESHPDNPNVHEAVIHVSNPNHIATEALPSTWAITDEFYNFKSLDPNNQVLMTVDESTYEGGTNGDFHPMAWYKEYDGGRSFYTAIGHTNEQFDDPLYINHLLGGIKYAIGLGNPVDYGKAYAEVVPEENRFSKVTFLQNLNEPMELDFLNKNKIIYIERRGGIHIYDLVQKTDSLIATMEVFSGLEDGLLGMAVDPNYSENNWIYLYYSNPDEDVQHLSRFDLINEEFLPESEKILLNVPTQREECCHSAGSVEFGPDGNLYVSTGDNTNPHSSDGFAPIDTRDGRSPWDAQKSSANTNDLRGKILRIKPEDDGTYSIPDGNLFPKGTSKTRPEIYVMGNRNPYRFSIDSKTNYLYWGEVGPDANNDSLNLGPKGYDEINQAREAGNFGWPHYIANNKPYHTRNFSAQTSGPIFDSIQPLNQSPNNTGLKELPPVQPAMIYYPYSNSEEFPALGTGGRNAMAGPIYYHEDFEDSSHNWPDFFNGKLLAYDWMRGWIFAVTMDEEGAFSKMTQIVPNMKFNNPIDLVFGPDGALYVLEYGTGWFTQNPDATLSRIEFVTGNRVPLAQITADQTIGGMPLTVQFEGRNSIDYDGDPLTYEWSFGDSGSGSTEMNPSYTFKESGRFKVLLEVTDKAGNTDQTEEEILVGNELPEVSWEIVNGNSSFFWPDKALDIQYKVQVSDLEDGSLADGNLDPSRVTVSINYLPQGSDNILGAKTHADMASSAYASIGKTLIEGSDCIACHKEKDASIGPSYYDIAERYADQETAPGTLAEKIINGGAGNWGETPMAAHPSIPETEARQMAEYILSLYSTSDSQSNSYPTQGSFTSSDHLETATEGTYILIASYTDNGGGAIEPLTTQNSFILRHPNLEAESYNEGSASKMTITPDMVPGLVEDMGIVIGLNDSYLMFKDLDMTGVKAISGTFAVTSAFVKGGQVEVRLGGLEGELIGTFNIEVALTDMDMKELSANLTKEIGGNHDIYFIFKNEDEETGAMLTAMNTIEFLNKTVQD
ncbi:MAG: carbohydrate-binding protein [Eudoraea sp.]|nr:carbohydrate-binding protein [Eudoraea sp.]